MAADALIARFLEFLKSASFELAARNPALMASGELLTTTNVIDVGDVALFFQGIEVASQRCREMGLRKAVKAAVADPEIDVPAPNGGRPLVAGALAVIYDPDTNEVITVLWALGESLAGGPVRRTPFERRTPPIQ